MIQLNPQGMMLYVDSLELSIDKHGRNSFISHAHLDHLFKPSRTTGILASDATLDLMDARGWKTPGMERLCLKDAGVRVELVNSGHVLGSSQLYVEDSDAFVYTSDFKLNDSMTMKGAEVRECDILLIESTYGSPEFIFPSREGVEARIADWVKKEQERGSIVVLGGYTLGKAQELIGILNEYAGITPIVNRPIARVCGVYEKHGIKLDYVSSDSEEAKELLKKSFVSVLPMNFVRYDVLKGLEEAYGRRVRGAIASGWALARSFNAHEVFCLSDHADYPQLLEYVERSGAKKIICMHGFAQRLAGELRRKGYAAVAVEEL
ncbi:hypothetical protein HY991_04590, partial [Candidatus Micrarchaeota archaeon]|nr:hypothetical protein [Candidatus Micrarchaeota archaeon]